MAAAFFLLYIKVVARNRFIVSSEEHHQLSPVSGFNRLLGSNLKRPTGDLRLTLLSMVSFPLTSGSSAKGILSMAGPLKVAGCKP
jgi:hypothetical protein